MTLKAIIVIGNRDLREETSSNVEGNKMKVMIEYYIMEKRTQFIEVTEEEKKLIEADDSSDIYEAMQEKYIPLSEEIVYDSFELTVIKG
jgi:hypothetical protein